jgi:hypothetical protein
MFVIIKNNFSKEVFMPRGDGTGPTGMGPMTGRGAGYCAGYNVPGFMNSLPGRGMGMGWGRGRGRGFGMGWHRGWMPPAPLPYYATAPKAGDELEILKGQEKYLSETLKGINQRISELETKGK